MMKSAALVLFFLIPTLVFGQYTDTLDLDLKQAMLLAQQASPQANKAEIDLQRAHWAYQTHLSGFKPQLYIESRLPGIDRGIQPITLPDGTDVFKGRAIMNTYAGLHMEQRVAATGGKLFFHTGVHRLDLLSNRVSSYLTNPITLGFEQPVLGFNPYKWQKKIEPIRLTVSEKKYSEALAVLDIKTAELFFDLLKAQQSYAACLADKEDADAILAVSRNRFELGLIALDELLQAEMCVLKQEVLIQANELALQRCNEQLRQHLGMQRAVYFRLYRPADMADIHIDPHKALVSALANRHDLPAHQLMLTEAMMMASAARSNRGLQMQVRAALGLAGTAVSIQDAGQKLQTQEQLHFGVSIPITDGGKGRADVALAETNLELAKAEIQQARMNFEREIILIIQEFHSLKKQLELYAKSCQVAEQRLEMSKNRFLLGKNDLAEHQLALKESSETRDNYLHLLQQCWISLYSIRYLTMYDFELDQALRPLR
jgi:outer membrane protein